MSKGMTIISIFFYFLLIFCSSSADEFCETPPEIANAELILGDNNVFPIGANISYACTKGYELNSNGTNYAVCLNESGITYWQLGVISCSPVCDTLPSISHGKLEKNHDPPFMPNEYIRFTCDVGYAPNTRSSKISCLVDDDGRAYWDPIDNICKVKVVSCGDPGDIENAQRIGGLFTFPNNVTYVCDEGYKLIGTASKFCTPRGVWTPTSPALCQIIVCPALSDPLNGTVHAIQRTLHAVAKYECNRYFKLSGNIERVCQEDGSWSGNRPTCKEITCFDPGVQPHMRVLANKDSYKAGGLIIFICIHGEHRTTSKCLETGEWKDKPPICPGPATESFDYSTPSSKLVPTGFLPDRKVLCDAPGEIKNAEITINGLSVNSTVTYVCNNDYQLKGKGTLICMENGKWDLEKLPICVKPLSVLSIVGIVIGVICLVAILVGGYFLYRVRERKLRGYGKKSKALTADATDLEEITGLEKGKKPIPVTVL